MSAQLSQVIANRLNMQPALISPSHADMLADSVRQLAQADDTREEQEREKAKETMLSAYGYDYRSAANDKPFVFADGIAFIPVTGLLINRFSTSWGWVTGYNFIRAQLAAAVDDEDVKLIVFDCNSGGGEVSGCFELCADIRASRDQKPSVAVVDSSSYSACYAIASSASKIIVTPSGGVGSIGVVAMHVDMSKMLEKFGVKVTFIYSGDHKVDGNPYESLPEPVRKSIQARVDSTRQEFVTLVSENRGLDAKIVHDTQAQCYSARDALALGLIDAIAPPIEAVTTFFTELSGSQPVMEKDDMQTNEGKKTGAESQAAATDKTNQEAAQAADQGQQQQQAADQGQQAEHQPDERASERERIKAIQTNEHAKGRASLAAHLALNTSMSVTEAVGILAASPVETQSAASGGSNAFQAAMDASDNPSVGADTTGDQATELTPAQRILRSQELATGMKHTH